MTKHANVAGTKGKYGWKKNPRDRCGTQATIRNTPERWKRSHRLRPRKISCMAHHNMKRSNMLRVCSDVMPSHVLHPSCHGKLSSLKNPQVKPKSIQAKSRKVKSSKFKSREVKSSQLSLYHDKCVDCSTVGTASTCSLTLCC